MSKTLRRPLLWGLGLALYLRFGLEPTAWLFYEASFALGIDGLYWGYSVFRGADHFFRLWAWQPVACVVAGGLLALALYRRAIRKEAT